MDDAQIKHMVNRFLTWRLPESFNPDGGITFEKAYNQHTPWPAEHEPVGTNLFSATEAEAMVRHMLDGLPAADCAEARARIAELEALINSPEVDDFMAAVPLEAAHQRERWGADHDRKKAPWDWYWTVGYLAGKAVQSMLACDWFKAKHHCVTVAALAASWHKRCTELEKGKP